MNSELEFSKPPLVRQVLSCALILVFALIPPVTNAVEKPQIGVGDIVVGRGGGGVGEDEGVVLSGVKADPKPFPQAYDPGHPAANAAGYVLLPNVNSLAESLDLKQAMKAYEANLNVLDTQDAMEKATLSILDKK